MRHRTCLSLAFPLAAKTVSFLAVHPVLSNFEQTAAKVVAREWDHCVTMKLEPTPTAHRLIAQLRCVVALPCLPLLFCPPWLWPSCPRQNSHSMRAKRQQNTSNALLSCCVCAHFVRSSRARVPRACQCSLGIAMRDSVLPTGTTACPPCCLSPLPETALRLSSADRSTSWPSPSCSTAATWPRPCRPDRPPPAPPPPPPPPPRLPCPPAAAPPRPSMSRPPQL